MRRVLLSAFLFSLAFWTACWGGRPAAAADAPAEEPAGYVDAVTGKAQAAHPVYGKRGLDPESPVYQGDLVETAPESALRIVFRDQTSLEMRASSSLTIAEYVYDPGDKSLGRLLVKYAQGVFRAVTGAIVKENPGRFSLEAPLASVGVRGTEIGSQVASGRELHALLSGTPIEVSASTGPPRTVDKPDYGVDVAAGTPIAPERPLTEEEKRLFAKMGFARQMDLLRRQTLFKTRTMVRPPKVRPHL